MRTSSETFDKSDSYNRRGPSNTEKANPTGCADPMIRVHRNESVAGECPRTAPRS